MNVVRPAVTSDPLCSMTRDERANAECEAAMAAKTLGRPNFDLLLCGKVVSAAKPGRYDAAELEAIRLAETTLTLGDIAEGQWPRQLQGRAGVAKHPPPIPGSDRHRVDRGGACCRFRGCAMTAAELPEWLKCPACGTDVVRREQLSESSKLPLWTGRRSCPECNARLGIEVQAEMDGGIDVSVFVVGEVTL